MRQPYIKGKGDLPAPSVMLEAADPDTMIQNIMSVAAKKIIAMGNAAHHGDEKDTKRLKDPPSSINGTTNRVKNDASSHTVPMHLIMIMA